MAGRSGAYDPWSSKRRHKCLDCEQVIPISRKRCYECQDREYDRRRQMRRVKHDKDEHA